MDNILYSCYMCTILNCVTLLYYIIVSLLPMPSSLDGALMDSPPQPPSPCSISAPHRPTQTSASSTDRKHYIYSTDTLFYPTRFFFVLSTVCQSSERYVPTSPSVSSLDIHPWKGARPSCNETRV